MSVVLTFDLGTSSTKAALWVDAEPVAWSRVAIVTQHPRPGFAEQEPETWWTSLESAAARLREQSPDAYATVRAIGCAAARESFVMVDEHLHPLGPGVLWSDRRGEAEPLLGDPAVFRTTTGVVLNSAAHATKVLRVSRDEPEAWARARWLLAPRDYVVARLTGLVGTDTTLASRTGWYTLDGSLAAHTPERVARLLPPVHAPADVAGSVLPAAASLLHVDPAVAVVWGAGDRQCEVLGSGATADAPMVSWGTTTNISVPVDVPTDRAVLSRGARSRFLNEAGLSSSGSAIAWLARLTGQSHDAVLAAAAAATPGANGVTALPWFSGARAPWWEPDVHASFSGLTEGHNVADLARAIVEAVALDTARCVDLVMPTARNTTLAGAGAAFATWRTLVAAATNRPTLRRRFDDAASVGARLLVGDALHTHLDVDDINPLIETLEPEPKLVDVMHEVRGRGDQLAAALLGRVDAP